MRFITIANSNSGNNYGELWKRVVVRAKNAGSMMMRNTTTTTPRGLGKSANGHRHHQPSTTTKASAGSNGVAQSSSSSFRIPPGMMKSALTSAGLGIVGDCVAQTLQHQHQRKQQHTSNSFSEKYDYPRTARQSLFNLTFYGPLQHVWYAFLGAKWPTVSGSLAYANIRPFATKVFLNQAALGPVVVACFFAWSQLLTNTFTATSWREKVQRDALPTLQKGWAFWVPASCVNFALVPVNRQVLYMSCCSVVWNCILSQAGNTTKEETRDASKKTKTKTK